MPTAKRQKYLDKQKKKLENQRTKEERSAEVDKVKKQLKDIGLSTEIESIDKFYKIYTFIKPENLFLWEKWTDGS